VLEVFHVPARRRNNPNRERVQTTEGKQLQLIEDWDIVSGVHSRPLGLTVVQHEVAATPTGLGRWNAADDRTCRV